MAKGFLATGSRLPTGLLPQDTPQQPNSVLALRSAVGAAASNAAAPVETIGNLSTIPNGQVHSTGRARRPLRAQR